MTLNYGELRKGMAIELDGEAYIIVDYQHNKMQQRAPTMRIRMRALSSGKLIEKSFSGFDVTFTPADVTRRKAQFIYEEDGLHYFMDNETFEQFPLDETQLGDNKSFIVEDLDITLLMFNDMPTTVELPTSVDLKVKHSDPGLKGDTAQGGTKPATLETGLLIQVPLFVNPGDVVKVDTRTSEYLNRV